MKTEITERQLIQEHLKQSLDELARHNEAMTGRESRIVELKAQVNSLLEELGRARAFEDSAGELWIRFLHAIHFNTVILTILC